MRKIGLVAIGCIVCIALAVFVLWGGRGGGHTEPGARPQEVLALLREAAEALKVGVDERMVLALFGKPTFFMCKDGEKVLYQGAVPPPAEISEKVGAVYWLYILSPVAGMQGMRLVAIENGIVSAMGYKYEGAPVSETRDFSEAEGLEHGVGWEEVVNRLGSPQTMTVATDLEADAIVVQLTYESADFAKLTIVGDARRIDAITGTCGRSQ